MKTLLAFITSQVPMTLKAYATVYGDDSLEANKVLVYADGFHIEVLEDGFYYLLIGRDDYKSKDLFLLEMILWDDFVKGELGLTEEEVYADLDHRAKSILDKYGFTCSLDEIDDELSHLSQNDKLIVRHLLEKFDEAIEFRVEELVDKNWYYECSSLSVWTSFDSGYVKAKTVEEAIKKAEKEIIENLEKCNEALKHCDNTKDFSVDIDVQNLRIRESND